MLTHILALAVGLGSVALYMAAFFFPEIHRKNDFIWSGVGLFYGLTLWVFTPRITGGLFLGHLASVALLGWFGWQTVQLRRQVTPQALQTPVASNPVEGSIEQPTEKKSAISKLTEPLQGLTGIFAGRKSKVQPTSPTAKETEIVSESDSEAESSESTSLDKAAIDVITEVDSGAVNTEVSEISQNSSEEVAISEVEETTPDISSDINSETNPDIISETNPDITSETELESQNQETPQVVSPELPTEELVEAAQVDAIQDKDVPPVEEIAPEAQLSPPVEVRVEETVEKNLNEDEKRE
ncbi:MAG: Ycf66 family protein [Cyanobacteria bacterium P01_A01_bin.45]